MKTKFWIWIIIGAVILSLIVGFVLNKCPEGSCYPVLAEHKVTPDLSNNFAVHSSTGEICGDIKIIGKYQACYMSYVDWTNDKITCKCFE